MAADSLTVALVSDVFFEEDADERLARRLAEARAAGAELAVLPELPLDPWVPVRREARPEDAEEPGGPRHRRLAGAARKAGIAVLGGAIVVEGGRRVNRALAFDGSGRLAGSYDKVHLPSEEGFWETAHYQSGLEPPRPIAAFGLPIGLQVCSDLNRPTGCYLLAARGAAAILAPRATEPATWERWRLVLRADAITSCAWVASVNRPRPETGVALGGPSVVIAPDGEVVAESTDVLTVARLDRERVRRAQRQYPGYMEVPAALYAAGWSA